MLLELTRLEVPPNFPGLPVAEVLPRYLAESKTIGRNKTVKAFRKWVREQQP